MFQGKARKIQALKTLLEMARSFPLEEQLLSTTNLPPERGGGVHGSGSGLGSSAGHGASDGSSLIARLAKIRAKFKQVQGLLQAGFSYATMPAGVSSSSSAQSNHSHHQHSHHHHHQPTTGHQHFQQRHPPPPTTGSQQHWQQQVPLSRTRSPVFRDTSFDSRTSGGPGGIPDTGPNEMSF